MAEIYGLYSARDGKIRYVGQTAGVCTDRFNQHKRSTSSSLDKWFRNEWIRGYPIECALLQSCDEPMMLSDVRRLERAWMAKFPGLLNERISAQTWFNALVREKSEKVPETAAYMRRFLSSAGGFRGVQWDRHWDCYRVLMYTGAKAFWLPGNEPAGVWDDENIWFSDRTAA